MTLELSLKHKPALSRRAQKGRTPQKSLGAIGHQERGGPWGGAQVPGERGGPWGGAQVPGERGDPLGWVQARMREFGVGMEGCGGCRE